MDARRFSGLAPILAILYSLGFTNLFLRSNFGVMAPDLARELALEPAMLSMVASAYFIAYAVMQVPTGMLLDRFGPRRTIATMLLFAALGATLFSVGHSATALVVARLLMGLGCAGVFTGAFYVLTHWLPTDRVVTHVGGLNSFASLGNLCATTPFALLIAWIGWRESYWIFTACIGGLALAVALVLRDAPSGGLPASSRKEGLAQAFAGVRDVLRQTGVKRLLVAGVPMSAAGTISGIWGAPYLKDVHALDDIGRGNVLLGMAVFAIAGHFLHGQLARRLNTIKGMIIAGSLAVLFADRDAGGGRAAPAGAGGRAVLPDRLVGRLPRAGARPYARAGAGPSRWTRDIAVQHGDHDGGGADAAGVRLDRGVVCRGRGRTARARIPRGIRRPGCRNAHRHRHLARSAM